MRTVKKLSNPFYARNVAASVDRVRHVVVTCIDNNGNKILQHKTRKEITFGPETSGYFRTMKDGGAFIDNTNLSRLNHVLLNHFGGTYVDLALFSNLTMDERIYMMGRMLETKNVELWQLVVFYKRAMQNRIDLRILGLPECKCHDNFDYYVKISPGMVFSLKPPEPIMNTDYGRVVHNLVTRNFPKDHKFLGFKFKKMIREIDYALDTDLWTLHRMFRTTVGYKEGKMRFRIQGIIGNMTLYKSYVCNPTVVGMIECYFLSLTEIAINPTVIDYRRVYCIWRGGVDSKEKYYRLIVGRDLCNQELYDELKRDHPGILTSSDFNWKAHLGSFTDTQGVYYRDYAERDLLKTGYRQRYVGLLPTSKFSEFRKALKSYGKAFERERREFERERADLNKKLMNSYRGLVSKKDAIEHLEATLNGALDSQAATEQLCENLKEENKELRAELSETRARVAAMDKVLSKTIMNEEMPYRCPNCKGKVVRQDLDVENDTAVICPGCYWKGLYTDLQQNDKITLDFMNIMKAKDQELENMKKELREMREQLRDEQKEKDRFRGEAYQNGVMLAQMRGRLAPNFNSKDIPAEFKKHLRRIEDENKDLQETLAKFIANKTIHKENMDRLEYEKKSEIDELRRTREKIEAKFKRVVEEDLEDDNKVALELLADLNLTF